MLNKKRANYVFPLYVLRSCSFDKFFQQYRFKLQQNNGNDYSPGKAIGQ